MSHRNQKRDVWNETVAVTRTPRENILRYLYQKGQSSAMEIRNAIYLSRTRSERDFRSLTDHAFVDRTVSHSSVRYELTAKGEQFVTDELLDGAPTPSP